MSPQMLLKIVPIIEKKGTKFWKALLPEQRIFITLRFLASEESQQSLSYNHRVGKSTV